MNEKAKFLTLLVLIIASGQCRLGSAKPLEKGLAFDFGTVCPSLAGKKWSAIIEGSTKIGTIAGKDSGVLIDQGRRAIFEKIIPDCGDGLVGISIRFSQDVVPVIGKPALGVYEVFVKDLDSNEVTGFALNSAGVYIDEVPTEIAFDKHGNKGDSSNKVISSRSGCFECHSRVSFDYQMPSAKDFWSDATIKPILTRELLGLAAAKAKAFEKPEAKPTAPLLRCEFTKQNWDNRPSTTQRPEYSKSLVQGEPNSSVVDALKSACTKCGPKFRKLNNYLVEGEPYLFHEITQCSLDGCYFTDSGKSAGNREDLKRLVPAECRDKEKIATPAGTSSQSANRNSPVMGPPPAPGTRRVGQSGTFDRIGGNKHDPWNNNPIGVDPRTGRPIYNR